MLEHDVLVIGAGLAGMRAAIAARAGGANTAIISNVHPVRSHSNAAQGGINAALTDRGDDWVEHAYDTVKGSDYLGDQDAIEVMCKAAGQALIDMETSASPSTATTKESWAPGPSAANAAPGPSSSATSPDRPCST